MKKIINGKKYDTETAEYIGTDSYEYPGNFHHYEDELYRKKTGEFFIAGSGGPLSKYAISVGVNEWEGSSAIKPLTLEEAKAWVEKNCDADTYIELFGEPEE